MAVVACGADPVTSTDPAASPTTTTVHDVTTTALPVAPTTTAPSTTAPSTAPEAPMTSADDSPISSEVIAGTMVQTAIDDLVDRTGADRSDIQVVNVEEVDWPDGSIGCPQPGMVYTQAIVNGSRIVLRHDGTDYAYHQGGSRPVFHCPSASTVEE